MAGESAPKPLAGIGTALAGGTTLITGVLAFLGVKDSALDRILVEQRASVLLFAALIAFGIGCGVVVRIVEFPGSVSVLGVTLLLSVTTIAVFWDIHRIRGNEEIPQASNLSTIFGVIFTAVVVSFLAGGYRISTGGALALLGATGFVLGAYGSVGLALDLKAAGTAPTLTASSLSRKDDGVFHLTATAAAESVQKCDRLVVTLNDDLDAPVASAGADVNRKATLPIDLIITADMIPDTRIITLRTAVDRHDCKGGSVASANLQDAEVQIHVPRDPLGPSLSAKWTDKAELELTISTADVIGHSTINVLVASQRSTEECDIISSATLPLPASGDLTVTMPVDVPTSATEIVVGGRFDSTEAADCLTIRKMPAVATLTRESQTASVNPGIVALAVPRRVYDSRTSGEKLNAGDERQISVAAAVGGSGPVVPEGAVAALVTLTVTETEGTGGYLSTFATGSSWAGTSSVNWFGPNQDLATSVLVGLDSELQFTVRSGVTASHFVVDVTGYITATG